MADFRTDLALEARNSLVSCPSGVTSDTADIDGFRVTTVRVTDNDGASVLCKPIGKYVTLELDGFLRREDSAFDRCAAVIGRLLRDMAALDDGDEVLVAGLGNRGVTPDALGPLTVDNVLITRHLVNKEPGALRGFLPVSAIKSGVLGTTGIESAALIKALVGELAPKCVIAVDALASGSVERVCRTVQISDAGIIPGSGVGNGRAAINRETLGVNVIAVGVPTVVDAGILAADIARRSGIAADESKMTDAADGMIVTPREIDTRVNDCARLIGYGINLALHSSLSVADVTMLLG